MTHVLGHLLAQSQVAYKESAITTADVIHTVLILLLAAALLILVINSWRACNLLMEIRDLLRHGGTLSRPTPPDAQRPPS